jgi:hypothetical protein
MTWTVPAPGQADGPLTGDDRPIIEGFLGWQRATLLNICAGLTGEQLATQPIGSSSLSLLGLIRHLAKVERIWFSERAAGLVVEPMYDPSRGKAAYDEPEFIVRNVWRLHGGWWDGNPATVKPAPERALSLAAAC